MFNCRYSWSNDPKPTLEQYMGWLWQEGKYVVEGDSNAHYTDVKKYVHPNAFNISQGGDIPQGVVDQFYKLKERHEDTKVERAYIQIGGNLYTWYPFNPATKNLILLVDGIRHCIDLYKVILDPEHIVIGSLPFIHPNVTIADMPGDDHLPKSIQIENKKTKVNDLFKIGNTLIKKVCDEKGVKYLDIYSILSMIWSDIGKKGWWDEVHYALRGQKDIGEVLRFMWGL